MIWETWNGGMNIARNGNIQRKLATQLCSWAVNKLITHPDWVQLKLCSRVDPTFQHKHKVKVKLFMCLTKHHAMKTYWGSGRTATHILNLGTIWRWVVSCMPLPLYPQGNRPQYPPDMRLDGPLRRSERGGEQNKSNEFHFHNRPYDTHKYGHFKFFVHCAKDQIGYGVTSSHVLIKSSNSHVTEVKRCRHKMKK
jgi:hypothetical protein